MELVCNIMHGSQWKFTSTRFKHIFMEPVFPANFDYVWVRFWTVLGLIKGDCSALVEVCAILCQSSLFVCRLITQIKYSPVLPNLKRCKYNIILALCIKTSIITGMPIPSLEMVKVPFSSATTSFFSAFYLTICISFYVSYAILSVFLIVRAADS